MKRLTILIMVFTSVCFLAEEGSKIPSKVISATVFKNRALVTRQAEMSLAKGKHKIIFSDLPVDLLDETVRVSSDGAGAGQVKILDVKVEQRFTTETQQKSIKLLEQKIDSLNQLTLIALDKISVYNSKKEFVESLKAQSSKYINEKMLLNTASTKEWTDMLNYVDNNLSEIYKGIREQTRKKTVCEQEINAIRSEIALSRGVKSKNFKEIIVNIEASDKVKIKLLPSYIVQSASWYPVYDARVISQSKEMELHYFGMLQQSTGEDWEDVSLTLSTAEPLTIKAIPQLERWFIDVRPLPVRQVSSGITGAFGQGFKVTYERNWGLAGGTGSISGYVLDAQSGEALPGVNLKLVGTDIGATTDASGRFSIMNIPAGQYSLSTYLIGYQINQVNFRVNEKNTANMTVSLNAASIQSGEVMVTAEKPVVLGDRVSSQSIVGNYEEPKYTNVYAKELSTTFEIPLNNSIPSDNNPHKVTIAIVKNPIEFNYTSIPRVVQSVYLKGKVVNKKEYPWLAGEINVFVDNDFINRTYLNTIVPTDTLQLSLGIDERIQAKKVLVNKFQESKGFLSGKRQFTYQYEIQLQNNRQTEESILLYDQVPIAMNENVIVELLEPNKELKDLDNDRKLTWNVSLKPGEKKIIPLKYQVTFPNNMNVYGLD